MDVVFDTLILILILICVALFQIDIWYSICCVILILGLVVVEYIYNWIRELEYEQ